jgi:hypothetical protein
MAGFTTYIDESGCDGFDFANGSTEFLVLGALTCRTANLGQYADAVTAIRSATRKPQDWTFKSFKKLNSTHGQRWCIAKHLAATKCNVVAVAVHKPSLTEQGWNENKEDLYFQASKFLLERVSWACRDTHGVAAAQPDGKVEIIFSKRGGLRYEDLVTYMSRLKADPVKYATKADWNHLDPDLVKNEAHDDSNPAHLAVDHFVSALGCALEAKEHGMFDDRYVRLWADRFYRSNGRAMGNGMKIWPNEGHTALQNGPRGAWLKMALG